MLKHLRERFAAMRRGSVSTVEPRRKMRFETLEPRILLSADLGMENPDPGPHGQDATVAIEQPLIQTQDPAVVASDDTSATDSPGQEGPWQESPGLYSSTEMVLVDPSVGDYHSLLESLRSSSDNPTQYEVHVLDASRDGIEQISSLLQDREGIDALHLVAHGDDGNLRLGTTILSGDNLSQHSDELRSWNTALSDNGDILLYGCGIAAGQDGVEFVRELATLTGADVAASTDATGGASLGGDWDLEYAAGAIESATLFADQNDYGWLLQDRYVTGTDSSDTFTLDLSGLTLTGGGASLSLNTTDNYFLNGAGGSDILMIVGGTGEDTISLSSSGITFNGTTYNFQLGGMTSVESVIVTPGEQSEDVVSVSSLDMDGSLTLLASQGTVAIEAGAVVTCDTGIFITAPTITIADGAVLTTAEDIRLIASAGVDVTWLTATPVFNYQKAEASIDIGAATLNADNVLIHADATTIKKFELVVDENALSSFVDRLVSGLLPANTSLAFTDSGGAAADAITRGDGGSWISDGFSAGQLIRISGTASNDGIYRIDSLTADTLTLGAEYTLVNETTTSASVAPAVALSGELQLAFNNIDSAADTIVRAVGTWAADGFVAGQYISVTGSADNDGIYRIASISGAVITLESGYELTQEIQTEASTSVASLIGMTAADQLTLATSGGVSTIVRDSGSWIRDGFLPGQSIEISGSTATITLSGDFYFRDNGAAADTIERVDGLYWEDGGFQAGQYISVAGANAGVYQIAAVEGAVLTLMDADSLAAMDSQAAVITAVTAMAGAPSLTFAAATADQGPMVSRDTGSWVEDGFSAGMTVAVGGSASNDGVYRIAYLDDLNLILEEGAVLTDEAPEDGVAQNITVLSPRSGVNNGTFQIQSVSADGRTLTLTDTFVLLAETGNGFTVTADPVSAADIPIAIVDQSQGMTGSPALYFVNKGVLAGAGSLTFTDNGITQDAISRDTGSWVTDGFAVGQEITVTGSSANDGDYVIDDIIDGGKTLRLVSGQELTNETMRCEDVSVITDTADTITRATGSWTDDDFAAGQYIAVSDTDSNDGTYLIAAVSADGRTLTLDGVYTLNGEITDSASVARITSALNSSGGQLTAGDVSDQLLGQVDGVGLFNTISYVAQVLLAQATSSITLGATINAAGNVVIEAEALANTTLKTPSLIFGVSVGSSTATASAIVENGAVITAGGDFSLTTTVDNTLNVTSAAMKGIQKTIAQKVLHIPSGPGLFVAVGVADSNNTAAVDSGAVIEADSVAVRAETTNSFSTAAKSVVITPQKNMGEAIGVAVATYSSDTSAHIGGTVTAVVGGVSVAAESVNVVDRVSAASAVKAKPPLAGRMMGAVTKKLAGTKDPKAGFSQFSMAASVAVAVSSNNAEAYIADGAVVTAAGDIVVTARAEDNFKVISTAAAKLNAAVSIAGAVAVTDYTNTASARIGADATVISGGDVSVTADAVVPSQFKVVSDFITLMTWFADLDQNITAPSIDFSLPSIDSSTGTIDFAASQNTLTQLSTYSSQTLAELLEPVQLLVGYLKVVPTSIATTFVQASSASKTEKDKKTGLVKDPNAIGKFSASGIVNVQSVDNAASAVIGAGAVVSGDTVAVDAAASMDTISIAGMKLGKIQDVIALLKAGGAAGNESSGSGAGGTYNGQTFANRATALVDDGAVVTATAGGITVGATVDDWMLNIAQAGGSAEKFGVSGAFAWNNATHEAVAHVEDTATLAATGNVDIEASTSYQNINIAGAIQKGGTASVGAAVVLNQVSNTTEAFVGDTSSSAEPAVSGAPILSFAGNAITRSGGNWTTDGFRVGQLIQVSGTAGNNGLYRIVSITAGGRTLTLDAALAAETTAAAGVSALGSITSGGAVRLDARSDELLVTVTVAASQSSGGTKKEETGSSADDPLDGESLPNLFGEEPTNVTQVAGIAISGGASVNTVSDVTRACVSDGVHVEAAGDLTITADNQALLVSVSTALGLDMSKADGGAALAGSFAYQDLDRDVKAYAQDAVISAQNVSTVASSDDLVVSVSAGGGGSKKGKLSVAGSADLVLVDSDVQAGLWADTSLDAGGDVTIDASGKLLDVSVAGAVSYSGGATGVGGFGAAADAVALAQTVKAFIGDNAVVDAAGDISITASQDTDIISVAACGAVTKGKIGMTGSASIQVVTNVVEASIGAGAVVTTPGSLLLDADDSLFVVSVAGAVAYGNTAGFGASGAVGVIDQTTRASIGDGASVSAQGHGDGVSGGNGLSANGIVIDAGTSDTIFRIAGGGGVSSKTVGGAFSASTDTMDIDTLAYIGDRAVINATTAGAAASQAVRLRAEDSLFKVGVAGSLGVSKAVGVGIAADVEVIGRRTKAYIGSNSIVNAVDDVALQADTNGKIFSFAAGLGIGSDTAGVAGSAAVVTTTDVTRSSIGSGSTVSVGGDVALHAASDMLLVGGAGVFAVGGKAGVGLTNVTVVRSDTVETEISGSTVTAGGAVGLESGAHSSVVSLAIGGAASSEFAAGAGIAVNTDTTTVYAGIAGNATVTAGGDVSVQALNDRSVDTLAIGGSGGGSYAGAAGVAANAVTNRVTAEIAASTVKAGMNADGSMSNAAADVVLLAQSSSSIRALALGVSGAGTGALSIAALGNFVANTIGARITGSTVASGGDVTLTARELAPFSIPDWIVPAEVAADLSAALDGSPVQLDANILAVNVSVAGSGKVAVSGLLTGNVIDNDISSQISGSTVTAGRHTASGIILNPSADVILTTLTDSAILALSVGVGASGQVAVQATGFGNVITGGVESIITSASTVQSGGLVALSAEDQSHITSVGLSVAASGSTAVSAIIGANVINGTVDALISGATVTSGSTLALAARSASTIFSFAGGVAASGSTAVQVTMAGNVVTNATRAAIMAGAAASDVDAVGAVTLSATDASIVDAIAFGVAGSGSTAVGVGMAANVITNSIDAAVGGSRLDTGSTLTLTAQSTEIIRALALGVAGSGSAAVQVTALGNAIINSVAATISGSTVSASGDIVLTARDLAPSVLTPWNLGSEQNKADVDAALSGSPISLDANILALNVGVAASGSVAVNAVLTGNDITGSVETGITGSVVTSTAGDIVLDSDASSGIISMTVGVAGSGTVAVDATGFGNLIANSTTAAINGGSVVKATAGAVDLDAQDSSLIRSAAVSVAGTGAVAAGALIGANVITNTAASDIVSSSVIAGTTLDLEARNAADIMGLSVGVAGSGAGAGVLSLTANVIANTTRASIQGTDTARSSIDAVGDITLAAYDSSEINTLAIGVTGTGGGAVGVGIAAASIANSTVTAVSDTDLSTDSALAMTAESGSIIRTLGIGVAGSGGFAVQLTAMGNRVSNTTRSEIIDGDVTAGDVSLIAREVAPSVEPFMDAVGTSVQDDATRTTLGDALAASPLDPSANIMAVNVSVAGTGGVAVNGVVTGNVIDNETSTKISGSSVAATGGIGLDALSDSGIAALTAGVAASGVTSINATGFGNVIVNDVTALVEESDLDSGTLSLAATDSADIAAAGVGLAASGSGSFNVLVAANVITDTVRADISDSSVDADTAVSQTAVAGAGILSFVGGVAADVTAAANVTFAANVITNIAEAVIDGGSSVTGGAAITQRAENSASIDSISFGVSAAGGGAGGAAAAANVIVDTTTSGVFDSTVTNAASFSAESRSEAVIRALNLGVSGAGGFSMQLTAMGNDITNTVTSEIFGSMVTAAGDISLSAFDEAPSATIPEWILSGENQVRLDAALTDSPLEDFASTNILALNVSAAGSGSMAFNIGLMGNVVSNTVQADIVDSTVTSDTGGVSATALSDSVITALSAGVGVSGDVALNITGFGNVIVNTVDASISDGSTVWAGGAATLSATDSSSITSIGLGLAGSGAAAINGTVGYNLITNSVTAEVSGSSLTSTGATSLLTASEADILSFVGGVAGSGLAAAQLSLTINEIENTISASIVNDDAGASTVTAGSVSLSATDASSIDSVAMGLSAAGFAAGGAAASKNLIANEVSATISGSEVTATGAVSLEAESSDIIRSYAIGVAGAGLGAASASLTLNDLGNTVTARVEDSTVTAGGNISLSASETAPLVVPDFNSAIAAPASMVTTLTSALNGNEVNPNANIVSFAGSISVSGVAALGAAVADNAIHSTVTAEIVDSTATSTGGSVTVSAASDAAIASLAAGFGASAGVAANASAVHNTLTSLIQAGIQGESTISADGDVTVKASDTAAIDALAFSLAGGYAAVGGAVVVNTVADTVLASIEGTSASHKAAVTAADTLFVTATSDYTVSGLSLGATAALVAAGGSVVSNSIGGTTSAYIGDYADIGGTVGNVSISAQTTVDVSSSASGLSGGISSGSVNSADASVNTAVDAHIGDADVHVAGAVGVAAGAAITAETDAFGLAVGGLAIGASLSDIEIGSEISAYVEGDADITAASLTVQSSADVSADAYANASGGGILAGNGADVDAVVTPLIQAFVEDGAIIAVSGLLSVASTSKGKAKAKGEGLTVGLAGIGVVLADAQLSPDVTASIGATAMVTAGGIAVKALHNVDVNGAELANTGATALVGATAGGLASGQGCSATATASAAVTADVGIGATLTAGGDIDLSALSANRAISDADGASYGGAAASVISSTTVVDGLTHATMDGTVAGASNLNVAAGTVDTASSTAKASTGGVVSGSGSSAAATVSPDVHAGIGGNVSVDNDVDVDAHALSTARASATGKSLVSGLTVGTSSASGWNTSGVSASIDADAVTAGGDISIGSALNDDGRAGLDVYASGSHGDTFALVGATGTLASGVMNTTVTASLAGSSRLTAGGDVDIVSESANTARVVADANAGGILAFGATFAETSMTANTLTTIGAGATIVAGGNGDIRSDAAQTVLSFVQGGAGKTTSAVLSEAFENLISGNISGFFSSISTPSLTAAGASYLTVNLDSLAKTAVGDGASLTYAGDLDIKALSDTAIGATALMKSGGLVGPYALAVTDISGDADAVVEIGGGAEASANNLTISADNTIDVGPYTGQSVLADAKAESDLAGAFGTAISRVDIGTSSDKSVADVHIGVDALIKADGTLSITAINHSDNGALQSRSKANADTGTFVATATASAEGSLHADATVRIDISLTAERGLYATNVNVDSRSLLSMLRGPEAEAAGFITHVDKVISYVTDTIVKYLPWPLNHIVDAISYVIREVISWVTWFEFSEANTHTAGLTSSTNSILLNASVHVGYGASKKLIINEDGSINPISTVNAVIADGKAEVEDIQDIPLGRLSVYAPNGSIAGTATIFLNNGVGTVLLENFSENDLVIGKVDLVNDGANDAQLSIVGAYANTFSMNIGEALSELRVLNHSTGDIELTDLIDNRPGDTSLVNDGGGILVKGEDVLVQTRNLTIATPQGDIASTGARLQVELYQRNDEHPEFRIAADGDAYVDLKGMLYLQTGTEEVPFTAFARELSVNGLADLKFIDGGKQTFGVSEDTVVTLSLDSSSLNVDLAPTTGPDGHSVVTGSFTPTVDVSFDPDAVVVSTPFTVAGAGTIISFGSAHGFASGDRYVYDAGSGTEISGLVDGAVYYVGVLSPTTIVLARSMGEIDGATFGKGDIDAAANTVDLGYEHNFSSGERVTWSTVGGATVIPGLVNDAVYYVTRVDTTTIRLAKSFEEAQGSTFTSGYNAGGGGGSAAGSVDATADTITLGYQHNFITGDTVVYSSGGAQAIGGLTSGETYHVIYVDDMTIKLASTLAQAQSGTAVNLSLPTANGNSHSIRLDIGVTGLDAGDEYTVRLAYDQTSAAGQAQRLVCADTIRFAADHGFVTGEEVVYNAEGGAIGELIDGQRYFVVVLDATTIQLALTAEDAASGDVLSIDPSAGTGSGHSLSSATVIRLDGVSYFETGQAVVYNGGGTDIGGLVSGQTYYVANVPGDSSGIRLALTRADALAGNVVAVDVHDAAGETGHSFGLYFDATAVDGDSETIDFVHAHDLRTGQAITYVNNSGGAAVGDLVSGTTYYVAVVDSTTIKLASSEEAALSMFATVNVEYAKQDLGVGTGPAISVSQESSGGVVTSSTITITLNTNPANPTTAQELVDAVNASAEAAPLIDAGLTGLGSMVVSNKYFGGTLSLSALGAASESGSYTFNDLILSGEEALSGTFVIGDGSGAGTLVIDGSNNNIELAGELDYGSGSVSIETQGNITSTGAAQLLRSGDITLVSSAGGVGDDVRSINVEQTGGELDAFAGTSVYISAGTGDIRVGEIEAIQNVTLTASGSLTQGDGDVHENQIIGVTLDLAVGGGIGAEGAAMAIDSDVLTVSAGADVHMHEILGDLNVDRVVSANGLVSLSADRSILETAMDDLADISGRSVVLVSDTGSVGTAGDFLDIDTDAENEGLFEAGAATGVFVRETSGGLRVAGARTTGGDIDLLLPDTVAEGEDLTILGDIEAAAGGLTINAGDDVTLQADASITVSGQVVINGDSGDADEAGTVIDLRGTIVGSSVEVYGGGGDDRISLAGAGVQTTVRTGDGDDEIAVGGNADATGSTGGALSGVTAALRVYGGAHEGGDTLILDDSANTGIGGGTIDGAGISGFGMTGSFHYQEIENLDLIFGSGDNTINILSTPAGQTTMLTGTGGNDTFNISSDAPANQGVLDGIRGDLIIHGGGGVNTLNVSDRGNTSGRGGVVITDHDITGMTGDAGGAGVIGFEADDDFSGGISILFGGGADDALVQSVLPGSTLTLGMGGGGDSLTATDTDPQNDGLLLAFGEGGADRLDASQWRSGLILYGDGGAATFGGLKTPSGILSVESTASSSDGDDILVGGFGNDILIGGGGGDVMRGGEGGDILIGDAGRVAFRSGVPSQAETMMRFSSIGGADSLTGGPGNDFMFGGTGSDTFYGNLSEDVIVGEYGIVRLDNGNVGELIASGDLISATMIELYTAADISVASRVGIAEQGPAVTPEPAPDALEIEQVHSESSYSRRVIHHGGQSVPAAQAQPGQDAVPAGTVPAGTAPADTAPADAPDREQGAAAEEAAGLRPAAFGPRPTGGEASAPERGETFFAARDDAEATGLQGAVAGLTCLGALSARGRDEKRRLASEELEGFARPKGRSWSWDGERLQGAEKTESSRLVTITEFTFEKKRRAEDA